MFLAGLTQGCLVYTRGCSPWCSPTQPMLLYRSSSRTGSRIGVLWWLFWNHNWYITVLFYLLYKVVGVCLKTAPSEGYTICKYVNWVGMHGRIGDKTTVVNMYTCFFCKAHFYNLFRLGAWKLNVNNVNLKHINRSIRFCNHCTNRNNNIMEDRIYYCTNRNNNIMEDRRDVLC